MNIGHVAINHIDMNIFVGKQEVNKIALAQKHELLVLPILALLQLVNK